MPAAAGVQPDAPNAAHQNDPDLADGPPAIDEDVGLESADEG